MNPKHKYFKRNFGAQGVPMSNDYVFKIISRPTVKFHTSERDHNHVKTTKTVTCLHPVSNA